MNQNHVLQRVIVELQLPTEDRAHDRQSAISRLFQDALPRAMDAVFSALVPSDKLLKIDSLVVDLGAIKESDFSERLFETRCLVALEQALKTAIREQLTAQSAENVFISRESTAFEAFVFFLKTGRLPWSFKVQSEENWLFEVLTAVEKSPKSAVILRGPILQNSTRLVQQFPLTFLWVLMDKLFPEWGKMGLKDIEKQAKDGTSPPFWKDFLLRILELAKHQDAATVGALLQKINADLTTLNITPFLKQVLIIKHLNAEKLKTDMETEEKGPLSIKPKKGEKGAEERENIEQSTDSLKETGAEQKINEALKKALLDAAVTDKATDDGVGVEPIYVNQAGLVLLFPFIDLLFTNVQLTDNRAFIDETARTKAVHLLHYLTTGKAAAGEYDLTLEKILCGVPLGMPMERDVILTENDRNAANNLLLSVIKHWTALGTCSVAGLRETFLQRSAKLTVSADENWRLQVERRTVDVLMDRLPWGCSMIKTAGMSRFMVVEW